jgi:thioredoxin reductase/NAD-dependent dihydropyrimidine dehydrogenase PreA subunit
VKRTLVVADASIAGRRRVAPHAEPTSDEKRWRGLGSAALAGAVVAVAVLVATLGPRSVVSPGPLARPHDAAGLECASCHASEPATQSCGGCHGAERALRPGHQELRDQGRIGCSSCHAIHRSEEGVTLGEDGIALHWGSGWTDRLALPLAWRGAELSVPLVRGSACTACHDASAPGDPAVACLPRPDGYNVCFDEHRRAGDVARGRASRDAAWQAAREVAAVVKPKAGRPLPALGALGAGLCAAALALVFQRRVRRRPSPPPSTRPSALELRAPDRRRLPLIDASRCLGCYACVDACPYDVLEVERYVAKVARPDDCCGLTLCEQRCPNGSLVIRDIGGAPSPNPLPELSSELEAIGCQGVYLAGDVTGTGLIRHAVEQGARAARAVKTSLAGEVRHPSERCGERDLIVIGAGPAGLAAALEARAAGLDVVVLEQATLAEGIRSFPRDKIVFDVPPAELESGPLWLGECTKEELLARWERAVRKGQLRIEQGVRVIAARRSSGRFELEACATNDSQAEPQRWLARRLVLAIGRRGSPRRLGATVPAAMQGRVHYHLADARSFAGRRVLVVGLGDSALEAVVALAAQPGTDVVVSYRGARYRRGKRRNVEAVERLAAARRVRIAWNTEVTSIETGAAVLSSPAGLERIECDALLVLVGSLPARGLLESLGLSKDGAHDISAAVSPLAARS